MSWLLRWVDTHLSFLVASCALFFLWLHGEPPAAGALWLAALVISFVEDRP